MLESVSRTAAPVLFVDAVTQIRPIDPELQLERIVRPMAWHGLHGDGSDLQARSLAFPLLLVGPSAKFPDGEWHGTGNVHNVHDVHSVHHFTSILSKRRPPPAGKKSAVPKIACFGDARQQGGIRCWCRFGVYSYRARGRFNGNQQT